MCSWNLAGVNPDDFHLLLKQLSDNYDWDILLMQEAFSSSDGIELESNHVLFVGDKGQGGQRRPAVLVHERWRSHGLRRLASGERWIAVDVGNSFTALSVHLPHSGYNFDEFAACFGEVDVLAASLATKIYMGIDANTQVGGAVDFVHVGETVMAATSEFENG